MFGGVLPLLKIKPFSLVLIVVVTVVRESEIGISITVWISYPDHSAGNPVRARRKTRRTAHRSKICMERKLEC